MPSGWSAASLLRRAHPGISRSTDLMGRMRKLYRRHQDFLLLDDQYNGEAVLLEEPNQILLCHRLEEVGPALVAMQRVMDQGLAVAGFLSYAAAPAFDCFAVHSQRPPLPGPPTPLLWFAAFGVIHTGWIEADTPSTQRHDLIPIVSADIFTDGVEQVLDAIGRGDIYQANLTFPAHFTCEDPLDTYLGLRARAKAPFGAYMSIGGRSILCCSPELFFRVENGFVEARPMKGTRPRSADPQQDRALREELWRSEKDRSENLMILDLLRNDLSRISQPGSVRCTARFAIEDYPSVWQMTSTVESALQPGSGPIDILRHVFPCGSIVGAPKIEATRVIKRLERYNRGLYTGSIGLFLKDAAVTNVAIRTLDLHAHGTGHAGRFDVGAGIVADSDASQEWQECLAKARFVGEMLAFRRRSGTFSA